MVSPLYRLAHIFFPVYGPVRGVLHPAVVGAAEGFRGPGFLAGTVTVEGVQASRPVRVYDRISGVLVRTGQSMGTGAYRFDDLMLGRPYTVVAIDSPYQIHNAVVADRVEAVTEEG